MIVGLLIAALSLTSFNDGWDVRREGEASWTRVTVPHDAAFGLGYDREEDWDQGLVRCPKTVLPFVSTVSTGIRSSH